MKVFSIAALILAGGVCQELAGMALAILCAPTSYENALRVLPSSLANSMFFVCMLSAPVTVTATLILSAALPRANNRPEEIPAV